MFVYNHDMKKNLRRIDYRLILIVTLCATQLLGAVYFYTENKKIKQLYFTEAAKRMETAQKLEELQTNTERFYGEFQEVGGLTAEGFTATLQRIDDFMAVHDENVNIYNQETDEIYRILDNHEQRIKRLE